MKLYEYEEFVLSKLKPMSHQAQLVHCALGIVGEAGEVAELVKKQFAYGKEFSYSEMNGELGDVLFYLVAMTQQCGTTLEKVMQKNVAKLQQRYPQGYSDKDAIARVDVNAP